MGKVTTGSAADVAIQQPPPGDGTAPMGRKRAAGQAPVAHRNPLPQPPQLSPSPPLPSAQPTAPAATSPPPPPQQPPFNADEYDWRWLDTIDVATLAAADVIQLDPPHSAQRAYGQMLALGLSPLRLTSTRQAVFAV